MHDLTITPTRAPAIRAPRRWPLILLALPAAVATWSGWVGLGHMTGFGVVQLLPGIWDALAINTAITLPIGVEAYAAFALSAWLNVHPALSLSTRRFAKWSALASLGLGMLGQIAYHLLETGGYTVAPVWVTTAVSCLPVLVLGMGAGLGHMISRDVRVEHEPAPAVPDVPDDVPELRPEPAENPAARRAIAELTAWQQRVGAGKPDFSATAQVRVPDDVPELDPLCTSAAQHYRVMLAEGEVPSIRDLKKDLRIGQDKAAQVQEYLAVLADAQRAVGAAA